MHTLATRLRYLALILPLVGLTSAISIGCDHTHPEDVGASGSEVNLGGYGGYGYGYDGYGYDGYGYGY